jgi:hypothetical protein
MIRKVKYIDIKHNFVSNQLCQEILLKAFILQDQGLDILLDVSKLHELDKDSIHAGLLIYFMPFYLLHVTSVLTYLRCF